MFKSLILLTFTLLFTACTTYSPTPFKNIDFEKNKTITLDFCSDFSYINNIKSEKYGDIFTENISLSQDCSWTSSQTYYFYKQFIDKQKIKDINKVEDFKFANYEFTTYLINKEYYVNFIYYFDISRDIFIIDYDGLYFDELIKEFDKNYINKFLNEKRYKTNYKESLVDNNFVKRYFTANQYIMKINSSLYTINQLKL